MDTDAIKRTRYVLTGGRWFLIVGLVVYSAMTTTPFVQSHSEWAHTGWLLGLVVDAAFIMALSAESTLAKHGVTDLGKWPTAFRWVTGLASVFLNVWMSVTLKDWTGVAVHLIAPALVMLLAEVGPVYMKALADAEAKARKSPLPDWVAEALERNELEPGEDAHPEVVANFQTPDGRPVPAPVTLTKTDPDEDEPDVDDDHEAKPARVSNSEANAIIEQGWRHRVNPVQVAAAAGRHPATVRRKYKELDAQLTI
ncbi:hypothetical protein ABZV65_04365 [Streptomyces bauhiniae]|uniref:hypothetical protein n=1 Tax=Streptomyces bauhiniae TaxID=2340725 RepID=UPI00339FEB29